MKGTPIWFSVAVFVLLLASHVSSGNRTFGLGLVVGEPTGINAKLWLKETSALNFVLAWGWGYNRYGKNYYYDDNRCYENGFYNNNERYCDGQYYRGENRYNRRGFHIRGDYLIHNYDVIKSGERLPLYYGPGVSIESFGNDVQLGARGNIGIAWMHQTLPFDIFLEFAPVLQIFPELYLDLTAGIGSRYYF